MTISMNPSPAELAQLGRLADNAYPHWRAVECMRLIHRLREEETASVTILCDNPGFGGANNAVEVCGEWTGWADRRFEGESLLTALGIALDAYLAAPVPTMSRPTPRRPRKPLTTHDFSGVTSPLRRQRSHVRIVSGAPVMSLNLQDF
jgi:hypothetical protein